MDNVKQKMIEQCAAKIRFVRVNGSLLGLRKFVFPTDESCREQKSRKSKQDLFLVPCSSSFSSAELSIFSDNPQETFAVDI